MSIEMKIFFIDEYILNFLFRKVFITLHKD